MVRSPRQLFMMIIALILMCQGPVSIHAVEFGESSSRDLTLLDKQQWNEVETHVWNMITAGKQADLCMLELPPDISATMGRNLRPSFLKRILLDESYSESIPSSGARIRGAIFIESLNFENAELEKHLALEHCYFKKPLNFNGVKTKWGISLAESHINGSVLFRGATIQGRLNMNDSCFHNFQGENLKVNGLLTFENATINGGKPEQSAVELVAARIDGQFKFDKANVFGEMNMPGIYVVSQLSGKDCNVHGQLCLSGGIIERQINLANSRIDTIQMPGIQVKSRLVLDKATVSGPINLDSMRTDGDVCLVDGNFSSVSLITADIEGRLDMRKSDFSGMVQTYGVSVGDVLDLRDTEFKDELRMQRSCVGSILYLNSAKFFGNVSLKGASIIGDLYTDSAEFREKLDMRNIRLDGELIINESTFQGDILINLAQLKAINYKGVKKLKNLDLTGTSVEKMIVQVKDTSDFPENLQLHGFTYNLFLAEYKGGEEQEQEFFQAWLKRLGKYTPQPYTQCAKVLREFGQPERANQVLFAGKEEERKVAYRENDVGRWLWLSVLKWTIGYGIGMKYFQSLVWFFLLVAVGTLICRSVKENANMKRLDAETARRRWANWFFYSMDNLLPIISLRELHTKIDPPESARLYFYFHRVAGWLLASFILAGLAGITQK